MMKYLRTFLTGCIIAVGAAAPAAGQPILVDHPPYNFGGPASDTDFFSSTSGFQVYQQLADNFTLPTAASIGEVHWWGFYGGSQQNHQPPIGDETMRLRFYDARPGDGLPGSVLFEETFLNPSRTATGRNVWVNSPNQPEFLFETTLSSPLSVLANTPYWLEVVQLGDVNSTFRWEFSTTQTDGYAGIQSGAADWQRDTITRDLAFNLYMVPEPSIGMFVFIGSLSLRKRCRNRGE
jgi:hypothetical protein